MTCSEKAKALLQLVDGSQFPGAQRRAVVEIAEWLEAIRDGRLVVIPAGSSEAHVGRQAEDGDANAYDSR